MPESALSAGAETLARLVQSVLAGPVRAPPVVTLSWAQSRTGALAPPGGQRTTLSGTESMILTHVLRRLHAAILVGIGTVITDDPQLTVRLVEGESPQPVVLDTELRFPPGARLLCRTDRRPWIFHGSGASAEKARELARRGARLFGLPAGPEGLPLAEVLAALGERGIASLMVEGGARVLRSFISSGLAHQAVITVSPVDMEGIRIFPPGWDAGRDLGLREAVRQSCGPDTVIWGKLSRSA